MHEHTHMIKLICKCSHSSENTKRHSLQRVRQGGGKEKKIQQSLKESCLAEWGFFSLAKPLKWDSSLTETMLVDEVETTEEEEPFLLGKREKTEHPKLLKSDLSKSKSSQRWHLLCQAAQRFPFFLFLWGLTVSPAMFEQDPLTISIDSGPSPFDCQSASQANRQNKKIWFQAALPFGSSLCTVMAPGNGGLAGRLLDSPAADTSATQGITCMQAGLFVQPEHESRGMAGLPRSLCPQLQKTLWKLKGCH